MHGEVLSECSLEKPPTLHLCLSLCGLSQSCWGAVCVQLQHCKACNFLCCFGAHEFAQWGLRRRWDWAIPTHWKETRRQRKGAALLVLGRQEQARARLGGSKQNYKRERRSAGRDAAASHRMLLQGSASGDPYHHHQQQAGGTVTVVCGWLVWPHSHGNGMPAFSPQRSETPLRPCPHTPRFLWMDGVAIFGWFFSTKRPVKTLRIFQTNSCTAHCSAVPVLLPCTMLWNLTRQRLEWSLHQLL